MAAHRSMVSDRNRQLMKEALGFASSNFVLFLTYALVFWVGSKQLQRGSISYEQMMIAFMVLMSSALSVGQALGDIGDHSKALNLTKAIFQTIDSAQSMDGNDGTTLAAGLLPCKAYGREEEQRPFPCTMVDASDGCNKDDWYELTGKIELRDVHFCYPSRPGVFVCKGLNLVIQPGEVVAFVGASGCGKSTLFNLLLRFYDPTIGSILVDDMDCKTLNTRYLRSQIGFVGQEPVLFRNTVHRNIALGRSEETLASLYSWSQYLQQARALEARVWHGHGFNYCRKSQYSAAAGIETMNSGVKDHSSYTIDDLETAQGSNSKSDVDMDVAMAAQFANADQFIAELPQQYLTPLTAVSGGQKQRLAIARAVIRQPSILLLDEATSALDANSERIIKAAIDTLTARNSNEEGCSALFHLRKPTVLIVAHRLSTVVNANRIVVMEAGAIVEIGTHAELMAKKNGMYRSLSLAAMPSELP